MNKVEAPDKIYIPITEGQEIAINEWGSIQLSQYEHKRVVENIEYTRTDAFIKKACEWLKCQDEMVGISFTEDFIVRFKDYLKGE